MKTQKYLFTFILYNYALWQCTLKKFGVKSTNFEKKFKVRKILD